jgi:hypothetical protein
LANIRTCRLLKRETKMKRETKTSMHAYIGRTLSIQAKTEYESTGHNILWIEPRNRCPNLSCVSNNEDL